MSGLVDIWTSELAKLREKGQTIWSSGSSPTPNNPPECSSKVGQAEGGSLLAMAEPLATWIKGVRVQPIGLAYSEASLSMLIDCFSA